MQKVLLLLFLFLIGVFQYQLRYGKGGYVSDNNVVENINQQLLVNQGLIDRNNKVMIKISGLKGSGAAIEARARSELNLIKKGEMLILLPEDGRGVSSDNTKTQDKSN